MKHDQSNTWLSGSDQANKYVSFADAVIVERRRTMGLLGDIFGYHFGERTRLQVLDLGGGDGFITGYMRERFPDNAFCLLDGSSDMLEKAEQRLAGKGVTFIQQTFEQYTYATTQALILYIIGVPFIAGIRNVAAVFYAYRDAKTPMYASFISVGLHVIISLGFMRIIGFRAFPLATTIASFVNLAILMRKLPSKIGQFELSLLVDYFVRLVIAAIIAGFAAILLHRLLINFLDYSFATRIMNLGISGITASLVCYVVCLMLGVTEAKDYIRRLFRK